MSSVYGEICGAVLARAHARTGNRFALASYLGKSDTFDRAIADFSVAYADQNERDYQALLDARDSGRIVGPKSLDRLIRDGERSARSGRAAVGPGLETSASPPRRPWFCLFVSRGRSWSTSSIGNFPWGLVLLVALGASLAAAWYGLLGAGPARVARLRCRPADPRPRRGILLAFGEGFAQGLLVVGLLVLAIAAARAALRIRTPLPDAVAPRQNAVLFYNPKSGGGKAEQFRRRGTRPRSEESSRSSSGAVTTSSSSSATRWPAAPTDWRWPAVTVRRRSSRRWPPKYDLPYACIPAGTRNHFALDLGVDRDDVVGALDAFVDGGERRVDLAEVNGRVFVNNVSLGIYAEAVQREGYREAKLRTILSTVPDVLGPERRRARSEMGQVRAATSTAPGAAILVSNNRYRLGRAVGSGTRPRIDDGLLGITVASAPTGRGSSQKGLQRPWREWSQPEFEVESDQPVPAGIDGEAAGSRSAAALRDHARGTAGEDRPAASRRIALGRDSRRDARWSQGPGADRRREAPVSREARPLRTGRILGELHAPRPGRLLGGRRLSDPSLDSFLRRLSHAADHSKISLSVAAGLAVAGGSAGTPGGAPGGRFDRGDLGRHQRAWSSRWRADGGPTGSPPTVPESRHVKMPQSHSFASGHSAAAFAFAAGAGRGASWTVPPLTVLASLVGYSRVHTGVHYPGDVIFGSLCGVALAELTNQAIDSCPGPDGSRRCRCRPGAGRGADCSVSPARRGRRPPGPPGSGTGSS